MLRSKYKILVVDDEELACESLAAWLREDGYTVETALSGAQAIELATAAEYSVVILDLRMPGLDGLGTLEHIRALRPEAAIFIVTAYATVDTAVSAIKAGAQDYLVKPCSPSDISRLVERTVRMQRLERENKLLRQRLSRQHRFQDIVTKSPKMLEVIELARAVAPLPSTVLLRGESGTGKGLLARAIHNAGDRAARPFVSVSCAALAETLLESELFGHEKGAFTGAAVQNKGKFELAAGGTIFLDEIGDISPKLQSDLLRVIEDRRFYRVGGSEEIAVDVRVIAATNRDLERAVREERFRDDLYFRLNVIDIAIPPLRERREDIALLARDFLERLAQELRKEVSDISAGALETLYECDWPGNVRELENAIERALVTCHGDTLTESDFAFLCHNAHGVRSWRPPDDLTLEEIEKRAVAAALDRCGGNMTKAAGTLGIDRSTLYDKVKRYDLRH